MGWKKRIYERYVGTVVLNKVISSPIRDVKSGVQFRFYVNSRNNLVWKDFGYESIYGNDVYAFVAEKERCDRDRALELVKEWRGDLGPSDYKEDRSIDLKEISYPIIFSRDKLTRIHYKYYETILVDYHWLDLYGLEACTTITKGPKRLYQSSDENIGFYWSWGKTSEKAYLPFNYWKDWKTGKDNRVGWFHRGLDSLEGWEFIDWNANHIIITKSMKDLLCLRAAGYNAICVSGEAMVKMLLANLYYLCCRFPRCIVWFDPDRAGQLSVDRLKREIPMIQIANSRFGKDASEIILNTGSHFWIHEIIRNAA